MSRASLTPSPSVSRGMGNVSSPSPSPRRTNLNNSASMSASASTSTAHALSHAQGSPELDRVQVLAAVLGAYKNRKAGNVGTTRVAVLNLVKERHPNLTADARYDQRFKEAISNLFEDGCLVVVSGPVFKLSKSVEEGIEQLRSAEDNDDEESATSRYLSSRQLSASNLSRATSKPPVATAQDSTASQGFQSPGRQHKTVKMKEEDVSDEESSQEDAMGAGKGKGRAKKLVGTTKPKRPIKKAKAVARASPIGSEGDESELTSDDDDVKKEDKKKGTKKGKGSRGGLTGLTKAQLVAKIKELRAQQEGSEESEDDEESMEEEGSKVEKGKRKVVVQSPLKAVDESAKASEDNQPTVLGFRVDAAADHDSFDSYKAVSPSPLVQSRPQPESSTSSVVRQNADSQNVDEQVRRLQQELADAKQLEKVVSERKVLLQEELDLVVRAYQDLASIASADALARPAEEDSEDDELLDNVADKEVVASAPSLPLESDLEDADGETDHEGDVTLVDPPKLPAETVFDEIVQKAKEEANKIVEASGGIEEKHEPVEPSIDVRTAERDVLAQECDELRMMLRRAVEAADIARQRLESVLATAEFDVASESKDLLNADQVAITALTQDISDVETEKESAERKLEQAVFAYEQISIENVDLQRLLEEARDDLAEQTQALEALEDHEELVYLAFLRVEDELKACQVDRREIASSSKNQVEELTLEYNLKETELSALRSEYDELVWQLQNLAITCRFNVEEEVSHESVNKIFANVKASHLHLEQQVAAAEQARSAIEETLVTAFIDLHLAADGSTGPSNLDDLASNSIVTVKDALLAKNTHILNLEAERATYKDLVAREAKLKQDALLRLEETNLSHQTLQGSIADLQTQLGDTQARLERSEAFCRQFTLAARNYEHQHGNNATS